MQIKKFDSVCIWSENPEKLVEFYKNIFGKELDGEINITDDKGYWFLIGEDKVIFWIGYHDKVEGQSKDPCRIMPGFTVDSVDKVFKELIPKGVDFIKEPSWSPDKSYRIATIADPEGNIIQFYSDYK